MTARLKQGFIGGCIGAIVLVIIMYIMQAIGMMEQPAFVSMYHGAFGENPPADQVIAIILFVLFGGVWGLLFGWMVKDPTIGKAMLFGFLPTLWLWVPVNAYLGKPLFNGFEAKGLIMPIVFNVVIWGAVLGWYMQKRVDPTLEKAL